MVNPADYAPITSIYFYCEYPIKEPRPVGWVNKAGQVIGKHHVREWCNEMASWKRRSSLSVGSRMNYLCKQHHRGRRDDGDYNK